MNIAKPIPDGYFDATRLLKELNSPAKVKVSQFTDNKSIQNTLITLPILSERGRYGYTWLPNEYLLEYKKWLLSVGVGKGRQFKETE